jgi:murein DD-endopeptidase MepM/ murein hydrolase activator NlpD
MRVYAIRPFFGILDSMTNRITGILLSLFSIAMLSACTVSAQNSIPRIATDTPTSTTTKTATLTATATATNTPTATATPTAQPFTIEGSPRAYTLFESGFQTGAACGWVDTFDFPLDPPNGAEAMGGRDFSRFRERYGKYHAGEDWRFLSGDNFGQPVFSIGHGEVTYAEPEGWGADQGVVIVRHTFPNGRSLLSFYGHLDPPSVVLYPGECIQRGQIVGQIGRPRTPPHLHFEIRTHFPYSTGGGYWSTDPAQAGWLPPSETIAEYRLAVSPGAIWTRSTHEGISQPLGPLDEGTFLVYEDQQLKALDLADGNLIWGHKFTENFLGVVKDATQGLIYTLEAGSQLKAYALPPEGNPRSGLTPLWEESLPPKSRPTLLPLPQGGVVINGQTAYSPQGEQLWQREKSFNIQYWAQSNGDLILVTDHDIPLWIANQDDILPWDKAPAGLLASTNKQLWLYASDGIYTLNPQTRNAQLRYPLPPGLASRRAILGLTNGGILFTHSDSHDQRILALDTHGSLLWEYSYGDQLEGEPHFLWGHDQAYIVFVPPSSGSRGSYATAELLLIDSQNGKLRRVFEASSRAHNPQHTWATWTDQGQFLLNIAGSGMILIDPYAAADRMED